MSTELTESAPPHRPVLRYHGGKWLLAPWIISHFPDHRVYVEPYAGAASVLIRKPRAKAEMVNDLDGEVVNLFRVLRDPTQARELSRLLSLTPYARSEYEAAYLPASDPVEQARRTMLKSFAGFGADGLTATWTTGFRDNVTKKGGATPARDWSNLLSVIPAFVERLRGVTIENRPAIQLIKKHDAPEALFFLDPPYPHSTRAGHVKRKHSYRFEMSDDDHRELAEVTHGLTGMVAISCYPCELYDGELYQGWHRFQRLHRADAAQRRVEVLWLNDAAYKARSRQPLMFDAENLS